MTENKSIVIATGGTGGHLFPAMGLAKDFQNLDSSMHVILIGGGGKRKSFTTSDQVQYIHIAAASLGGRNPIKLVMSGIKIIKGVFQSLIQLRKLKPKLIVGMGSFYSFPVLAAAWLLRVPIYLHEGNAVLGKVNRLFLNSARVLGVQFPVISSDKSIWMPLPLKFAPKESLKEEGFQYFKLHPGKKVMLIMGGSQGALFINKMMMELAPLLKKIENDLQIIHITGKSEFLGSFENLYKSLGIKACVKGFEKRMDLAWSIASFALTRAGAASIAEIFTSKVPAIFIPYPYAADGHQKKNAEYVVDVVKGGYSFDQNQVNAEVLDQVIKELYKEDCKALKRLHLNLERYKEKVHNEAQKVTQVEHAYQLFAAKIKKDLEGTLV